MERILPCLHHPLSQTGRAQVRSGVDVGEWQARAMPGTWADREHHPDSASVALWGGQTAREALQGAAASHTQGGGKKPQRSSSKPFMLQPRNRAYQMKSTVQVGRSQRWIRPSTECQVISGLLFSPYPRQKGHTGRDAVTSAPSRVVSESCPGTVFPTLCRIGVGQVLSKNMQLKDP